MDTTADDGDPTGGGPATDARARPAPAPGVAVLLAALSAGAGVIHLVMAPVHAASSGVEAAGFALAGWLQLLLAAVILVWSTRSAATGRGAAAVLGTTVVANLAFIAVWAASRTAGLPVGHDAGTAEAAGAADLVCVVLEAGAVLVALALWLRPDLARSLPREAVALGALVPGAALLVVTLVVVSPDTAQHAHGDEASPPGQVQADYEQTRCDRQFNPRAYWAETAKAGVDTGETAPALANAPAGGGGGDHHGHEAGSSAAGPTTTTAPDPLAGRGSKKLDSVVAKLGSESEADAAQVVSALADFDDREYEAFLYQLRRHSGGHHAAQSASGDDTGGHGGHMGPTAWVPMTDRAQCDTLTRELGAARDIALRHPTAADAEAAGWRKVTNYVAGIGAHYMNFAYVDGTFELEKPEMILYDGNGPEARVVGLSYYIMQPGDAEPTQGFTGDNDHAHRHIGLCSKDGVVMGPSTMTKEACEAAGGRKGGGQGGWMSHAWVVPGCESPWGVFSGATPLLDRQLGQESGKNAGGCAGSKARQRYDLAPGQAPVPSGGPPTESAAGR